MILRYDAAVTRWEPALMRSFEIGRGQTHGSASDGPSPMDVDRVQKGKGKGKGKYDNKGGKGGGKHGKGDNYATGKGKGGDSCLYCGKPGHWKRDCRKLKWDKEHNNVRMTSGTGGDMQTPYNHQPVPPPPNTGGTTSVPQSSAASNASTGTTFRTATTVRRVSGTTVYRIDEDENPYDLTIFALEEQDSEPECNVQFLRMIQHVRVSQPLFGHGNSFHGTIKAHDEPERVTSPAAVADTPDRSTCEFFDIAATDTDGKWDFIGFDEQMTEARMVTPDMGNATGSVEIILDSGADVSCLPYEYSAVGVETQTSGFYRDAAGNPLNVTGTRRAIVQLGDAQKTSSSEV